MATFTERQEHKIEIIPPYSILQCRRADIIEKDGVEVGRTYHRHVASPGDDMTNECDEMKAVAAALWTPEVIAAYHASISSSPRGPQAPQIAPDTLEQPLTPSEDAVVTEEPQLVQEPEVTSTPVEETTAPAEEPVMVRARNEDGTYIADDPSTPDVNEAWVEAEPTVDESTTTPVE